MFTRALKLIVFLTLGASSPVAAQGPDTAALTADRRQAVVDSIGKSMKSMYVFPDVAARMDADLQSRLENGEFDKVSDASAFAEMLTRDLQAISHDKHVRVRVVASDPVSGPAGGSGKRSRIFGRAERMSGDVGYIEILSFGAPPETVREEAARIMSSLADAKALIVDLRANEGGSPFTVALLSSYLFGPKPVHLNSLYFRQLDRTDDLYTDPTVPGTRFGPEKPVYVLTSSRTFSAAEEFAYNLQTRKRATIVGETTAGGANPGRGVLLPCDLTVFVPTGRAINPITKTNWEGVGVKPDVAVPGDEALDVAHRLAQKAATVTDAQ